MTHEFDRQTKKADSERKRYDMNLGGRSSGINEIEGKKREEKFQVEPESTRANFGNRMLRRMIFTKNLSKEEEEEEEEKRPLNP